MTALGTLAFVTLATVTLVTLTLATGGRDAGERRALATPKDESPFSFAVLPLAHPLV